MDDEATQLLREMRDMLRDFSAWHKQFLASTKRARRIIFLFVLPILIGFMGILTWAVVSSNQTERRREEEERRYHDQLQRNHEEMQRKLEERRNLVRPLGLNPPCTVFPPLAPYLTALHRNSGFSDNCVAKPGTVDK